MVTAYDHPSAVAVEEAGVDVVLVGDSAANNVLGYADTVPVTIEELLMLAAAVRRGLQTPLLVGDLPFGSYEASDAQAIGAAHRFVKEAGCDAVKLEGGGAMAERARAIVRAGVPVMGHVGLTPQTATALGGYRAQGRTAARGAPGARGRARAAGGRLLRDRLRGDPRRGDRRDHAAHGDPGHRDRRRAEHRRPGARAPRPARHPRRLPAEVRQALRGRQEGDGPRRARRTRRTCARAASRGPSTPTGSPPRSSTACGRSCRRTAPWSDDSRSRLFTQAGTSAFHLHWPPWRACPSCSRPRSASSSTSSRRPERTSCAPPSCSSGCSSSGPTTASWLRDVVVCEQEGDRITHDIIQRLNSTFVTPIDREDIYALASALDDIVDFIEEIADFLGLYRIEAPMEQAQRDGAASCTSPPARSPARSRGCARSRTSTTTPSRSTGSRTTATACCARRSPRCSSAGSTRCS